MTKQFVQAVFITAVFLCSSCNILAQDAFTQNLTQNVSIANSMTVDKFTQLMQQGFKSVIVHRPDNEAGNLVSVSQLRDIAEKNGLVLSINRLNRVKLILRISLNLLNILMNYRNQFY